MNWLPARNYLRGAKPVYAESLTVGIKTFIGGLFLSVGHPAYIYHFGATPVYVECLTFILCQLLAHFLSCRVHSSQKAGKNWFYIDIINFLKIVALSRAL